MPDDAPWIDPVVVPDDIRALQPDIEAYHRELRQAARRRRWRPLVRFVGSPRLAVPVIVTVGALLLAGVVVAVLTMGDRPVGPRAPAAAPVASGAVAVADVGQVGGVLPAVDLRNEFGRTQAIRSVRPALVALVPLQCRCTGLLGSLAGQAGEVGVPLVVVAPAEQDAEVAALSGELHSDRVVPLWDAGATLASVYHASGVTVLVVGRDATVTSISHDVVAGARLDGQLLNLLQDAATTAARP